MATTLTETNETRRQFYQHLQHIRWEYLIAGISGGVVSTLLLHPLDLIKIRFAVNDNRHRSTPNYNGILNAFATIIRQEGYLGLYKGVTPNIWGAASAWGLYFLAYNTLKGVQSQNGNADMARLGPSKHLIAASQAGLFTLVLTNPIWVVKTRMCLQYSSSSSHQHQVKYNGLLDALKKIYVQEGVRGYYKGFIPGIFGISHGAVQFMIYEELKERYNYYSSRKQQQQPVQSMVAGKLGAIEYLTFAAISKLCAVSITYPYQVVRARLQNQFYSYSGMNECIRQTWRFEGPRGFYKGMGTNLLRVTPATMITFLTYEKVSQYLINTI